MGVVRLRDLRAAGAVVGLATDGAACNHRQDLFECMKQAVLLQRVALDPTAARCEEALEMATRDGARFVGVDAGILAPGKLADLIVVALDRPHHTPVHRPVAALVYSVRGSDVEVTIVGGRVVYEDRACTLVDEGEIIAEARARGAELVERAGMRGLLTPWHGPAVAQT